MVMLPYHTLFVSSMPHFSVVITVMNTYVSAILWMTVDMLSESNQMFLNDPVWLLQCRLSLQHLRSLSVGISLLKPQTQDDGNGARALAIASPVLTVFEFATK